MTPNRGAAFADLFLALRRRIASAHLLPFAMAAADRIAAALACREMQRRARRSTGSTPPTRSAFLQFRRQCRLRPTRKLGKLERNRWVDDGIRTHNNRNHKALVVSIRCVKSKACKPQRRPKTGKNQE